MNIDSLHRQIDKMLSAIEQQRGPAEEDFFSDMRHQAYLLPTEQEQADMLELLAAIEQKTGLMTGWLDGIHAFRLLTDSERDKLSLWVDLLQALTQEDREAAARYRRYLSEDLDTLIARFMSIDEQSLPEAGTPEVQMIQRGHMIYPLTRIMFRSDRSSVKRAIEGQGHLSGETDTMRLWCDCFSAAVANE